MLGQIQAETNPLNKFVFLLVVHKMAVCQICALFSQVQEYKEAAVHANEAIQISHFFIHDAESLCSFFLQKSLFRKNSWQKSLSLSKFFVVFHAKGFYYLKPQLFSFLHFLKTCTKKFIGIDHFSDIDLIFDIAAVKKQADQSSVYFFVF